MECKAYIKPGNLSEAVDVMKQLEGKVQILAGGTDVLVKAREKNPYTDCTVVDLYGLPELTEIEDRGAELWIGAGVTHAQISASPLVNRYAEVLAAACDTVGSPQIRAHATIGGNIANASPAADSFAALSVLHATAVVNHLGEERVMDFSDLIEGPYHNTLSDRDIITGLVIKKLPEGTLSDFTKVGRRKALSISRMTIATVLKTDASGLVELFTMTMGATFPKPMTFPDIDALLLGKVPTRADVLLVAEKLSAKIPEIAGIRPSTAYKQPVCQQLAERILTKLLGGEAHV